MEIGQKYSFWPGAEQVYTHVSWGKKDIWQNIELLSLIVKYKEFDSSCQ